eukprot:5949088-Prymnesium_polylepis.1
MPSSMRTRCKPTPSSPPTRCSRSRRAPACTRRAPPSELATLSRSTRALRRGICGFRAAAGVGDASLVAGGALSAMSSLH